MHCLFRYFKLSVTVYKLLYNSRWVWGTNVSAMAMGHSLQPNDLHMFNESKRQTERRFRSKRKLQNSVFDHSLAKLIQ